MPADDPTLRTKWVPLRRDQIADLDDAARELQDAKTRRGGERITANTLIRIGIDVVLNKRERLSGDDEDQIRAALFEVLDIST